MPYRDLRGRFEAEDGEGKKNEKRRKGRVGKGRKGRENPLSLKKIGCGLDYCCHCR